ncbi:hypothetical protein DVP50_13585 [Yersinia enterocolitica]|nr:hypothetical protein [Yersinia enterocolitica]
MYTGMKRPAAAWQRAGERKKRLMKVGLGGVKLLLRFYQLGTCYWDQTVGQVRDERRPVFGKRLDSDYLITQITSVTSINMISIESGLNQPRLWPNKRKKIQGTSAHITERTR